MACAEPSVQAGRERENSQTSCLSPPAGPSLDKNSQKQDGMRSQVMQSTGVSLPEQDQTEKVRTDHGEGTGKGGGNKQHSLFFNVFKKVVA